MASNFYHVPYTTLVSTGDLANSLTSGFVIADCRSDLTDEGWGASQYKSAHIPGAVYVDLAHDLSAPPTGSNGRHPLPSRAAMSALFSRLGIAGQLQVVIYDQDSGMFASRLWWMLRYAGHRNAAVLDGGWAKWVREGRPTHAGLETRDPAAFEPHWQVEWLVELDEVERLCGCTDQLLLDARAPERFQGQVEPIDRVPGHIPGAANRSYRDNLAPDGTMLPAAVLRQQFEAKLGDHQPEDTVMYCGSGVSACHNLLAMEHAGLAGARLYVGSWSEWSADATRPVETGPGRG